MNTLLRGLVQATSLQPREWLSPIMEAVYNSLDAIRDAGYPQDGYINIRVERAPKQGNLSYGMLGNNSKTTPITSVCIEDNGIGFIDPNFESFENLGSQRKIDHGGKGLGRILWVKAFQGAVVESTYSSNGASQFRRFEFSAEDEIHNPMVKAGPSQHERKTIVQLRKMRSLYARHTAKTGAPELAVMIIGHCILKMIQPGCPRMTLIDDGNIIDLSDLLSNNLKGNYSDHSFQIGSESFSIRKLRLSERFGLRHSIIYAGHSRTVKTVTLVSQDHNFQWAVRENPEDDDAVVYVFVVEGKYLDENLQIERNSFTISESDDESSALIEEIRFPQIRKQVKEIVERELRGPITAINKAKEPAIVKFIEDNPQYRLLANRHLPKFISRIPPNPKPDDIDKVFHNEQHIREATLREESRKIVKINVEESEEYLELLQKFMALHEETEWNKLAGYVSHRRVIVQLFQNAMRSYEKVNADGKTKETTHLEKVIHRLVHPMRCATNEIQYQSQNLWMIDERLNYHSYIASDEILKTNEPIESESDLRPDIFALRFNYGSGGPPYGSIVVVEFKRPGRKSYKEIENPITEIYRHVDDIRNSKYKVDGEALDMVKGKFPAYAYIVCTVTDKIKEFARLAQLQEFDDHQGWFGYNQYYGCYVEIIDYKKVLSDSRMRNQVFFEHLNLPMSTQI